MTKKTDQTARAAHAFFPGGYAGTALIIVVAVLAYELATDVFGLLDKMLFPGFSRILPALIDSLPHLLESFCSSMALLVPGYLAGAVSGIVLGLLIGLNPGLNKAFRPIIFA